MNIYQGKNSHEVTVNGKPLPSRNDLVNHSPEGFAWGYAGSGPSQLALAIMANEFGDEIQEHPVDYMDFKSDVISQLKGDSFQITWNDILDWITEKKNISVLFSVAQFEVLIEGRKKTFKQKLVFKGDGTDFRSFYDAQKWLRLNGFSYGSMCGGQPIGIAKGDVWIAKWRNIPDSHMHRLDGIMLNETCGETIVYFNEVQS